MVTMQRKLLLLFPLLICLMTLTMVTGIVHANECDPEPVATDHFKSMCITTDKTSYSPGENMIITVEFSGYVPSSFGIYEMLETANCNYPAQIYGCTINPWVGQVAVHQVNSTISSGTEIFQLPSDTVAGNYDLLLFYSNYNTPTVGAFTQITVT